MRFGELRPLITRDTIIFLKNEAAIRWGSEYRRAFLPGMTDASLSLSVCSSIPGAETDL